MNIVLIDSGAGVSPSGEPPASNAEPNPPNNPPPVDTTALMCKA